MHWALKRKQRPLLGIIAVLLLIAAVVGTWTGGQRGALTAIGGVVISALVIGLLWIVIGPKFEDRPINWFLVLVGAVLVVGGVAFVQNDLPPTIGNVGKLATIAVVVTTIVAATGFVGADSVVRGAGYGLLTGALGGLLFVPFATYESFTMQPSLDAIVLLSGAIGPLVFGILGGIGGAVGGSLHSITFTDEASS